VNESKKNVLCANVIVIEHASFFLRQYNNATGSIGKALKHVADSF
jgi:hypothetical protein